MQQVQALYMDHCFLCAFPGTVHLAGVTCYILPWVSSTRFNVSLFASHHSAESTAACFHYPLQQPQPLLSHTLSAWLTQSAFDSSVHKGLQVLVPRKKKKRRKPTKQRLLCSDQLCSVCRATAAIQLHCEGRDAISPLSRWFHWDFQGGNRLTERDESRSDLPQLQNIFHCLLLLRTLPWTQSSWEAALRSLLRPQCSSN